MSPASMKEIEEKNVKKGLRYIPRIVKYEHLKKPRMGKTKYMKGKQVSEDEEVPRNKSSIKSAEWNDWSTCSPKKKTSTYCLQTI